MPPIPPPLPRSLADPQPVITIGTIAWFAAALILYLIDASASWVWTCLLGGGLGFIGFTVLHLQRSATRRGAKGAQRGLL